MKKLTILSLILVLAFVALGFKCGKGTGTGGGGAGNDWEFVVSISSNWVNLPNVRPPLMSGPNIVKIYSDKPVSPRLMDKITKGIQNTLYRSNWNNPKFNPPDWWQKDGKPFSVPQDYSVVLIPAQATSQSAEYFGCGLIWVRAGDAVTAIGTNAGQQLINGVPKAPGGLYLVIAGPADNEPDTSNCDTLRGLGTAAEAEHARAMGAPAIWFDVQAIDFTTGHPYFLGPNGEGMDVSKFGTKPDGTRADYASYFPSRTQLRDVQLTPEQMEYYQRNPKEAVRDASGE